MLKKTRMRMAMAILALLLAVQLPAHAAGKLNVNTATVEQLQDVKGIGSKTAAAIVAYRKEHGAFGSLDELTGVKGIGEKRLEKLRGALTVGKGDSDRKDD